jgi:putative transposase
LLYDPGFLRGIVEGVFQYLLEAEITQHLGVAPHERTENHKGHRNGHNSRKLKCRVGTLDLLVPQDWEGTFSTNLFARYQRDESLRLVMALAVETSEEWLTGRRYLDIEELRQERSLSRAGEEVVFTQR